MSLAFSGTLMDADVGNLFTLVIWCRVILSLNAFGCVLGSLASCVERPEPWRGSSVLCSSPLVVVSPGDGVSDSECVSDLSTANTILRVSVILVRFHVYSSQKMSR